MSGVIYSDIVAVAIAKLQALLEQREEAYSDAEVTNKITPGHPRNVTIQYAGGPGELNTLDTSFLAVNVVCTDEGDASDLARLVRAIFTGRGAGTMCDGDPITYTDTNVGPTPIDDDTEAFRLRMLFEVQHRGINL